MFVLWQLFEIIRNWDLCFTRMNILLVNAFWCEQVLFWSLCLWDSVGTGVLATWSTKGGTTRLLEPPLWIWLSGNGSHLLPYNNSREKHNNQVRVDCSPILLILSYSFKCYSFWFKVCKLSYHSRKNMPLILYFILYGNQWNTMAV